MILLNPVFINRIVFHLGLITHWIIVLVLYFSIKISKENYIKLNNLAFISGFSLYFHPYLAFMCCIIFFFYFIFVLIRKKTKYLISSSIIYLFIVALLLINTSTKSPKGETTAIGVPGVLSLTLSFVENS